MITPYNISTIYVSQKDGIDRETGFKPNGDERKNGPVKTIERALELVSQMRRMGINQPVTIKIMDDEYRLEKPVVIGANVQNITIEPYKKTLISGGIKINGFKRDVFNGVDCISAYVPEVAERGLWFTDFYVNNKHAKFTHYPKNGFLHPLAVDNNDKALHTHSKWFIADKNDLNVIKNFKNLNDCFISYNHYWVDEHTPIESYNLDTGKIVCKYYSRYSVSSLYPASAMEYIIENVAECFKNPNEWYLDRDTAKVYYIPENKDMLPEEIFAYAPVCDKLFVIKGEENNPARNIYIRDFELAYTRGDYCSKAPAPGTDFVLAEDEGFASDGQSVYSAYGSVEFELAHNCSIENCVLHSLGIHAVNIKGGCLSIRVTDNEIYDIGAGGISCGGENTPDNVNTMNGNNFISNNLIKALGRRYLCGCGILVCHSFGNIISHNDISDLYYTGISVGWVWGYTDSISQNNTIEYNHIHNIGQGVLSDMGGIYLLGKQQGTAVRNNVIHGVDSKHYGGWGIYTDEGSSYITVENNICYDISCNCYFQHFGNANVARNNIFVKAKDWPVKVARNQMHLGMIFENNIMVSEGVPVYKVGYEDEDSGSVHNISTCSNLIYDRKYPSPVLLKIGDREYSLEEVQNIFGLEEGGVIADPMFEDFDNNDFTLKPDSPAIALGFKPIDIKKVGIQ